MYSLIHVIGGYNIIDTYIIDFYNTNLYGNKVCNFSVPALCYSQS